MLFKYPFIEFCLGSQKKTSRHKLSMLQKSGGNGPRTLKSWWLEDEFQVGIAYFQGLLLLVSGSVSL